MTDQDYVEFCDFVADLRLRAEAFFTRMSDEQIYQLDGLVRKEIAACPNGKVGPAYDFLAAILAEEAAKRKTPSNNIVQMPKRSTNDALF